MEPCADRSAVPPGKDRLQDIQHEGVSLGGGASGRTIGGAIWSVQPLPRTEKMRSDSKMLGMNRP